MKSPHAPVVVHLSGAGESTTQVLSGSSWTIGTSDEAQIRVRGGHGSPAGELHATLSRSGDGYSLRAHPPHTVWVNGRTVEVQALSSGDLIEIGAEGPLLRFRLQPAGRAPFKTMRQAIADCWTSAARDAGSGLRRLGLFARTVVREVSSEISPLSRVVTLSLVALLVAAIVLLVVRGERLERRLESESRTVAGLEELLATSEGEAVSAAELEEIRRELESRIASTTERVDYLEERAGAAERTISEASRSVVFLQGSYGFRDPADGKPLRVAVDAEGRALRAADGNAAFTTEGEGPLVEALFTGTAFVATADGLLVTNRHVALPWEYDRDARTVVAQGLEPMMIRLIGYLSGLAEAFEIELALASDDADLAVLRAPAPTHGARPLAFDPTNAQVGEAVIVMGFPTGIQAMLARADPSFVEEISEARLGFWQIAERLAAAGQIGPLATRGIIGQATESTIVYDAETTSGGSGGPVLGLDGRVVAVTSAVLTQFGGSNLGVPASLAMELLERVREDLSTGTAMGADVGDD